MGRRIKLWFGYGWAQPVTSRTWALAASLLSAVSAGTGHRVLNHAKHVAWCKAVGVAHRTVV